MKQHNFGKENQKQSNMSSLGLSKNLYLDINKYKKLVIRLDAYLKEYQYQQCCL